MRTLNQNAGRSLFGGNPEAYDRFRPSYPQALFETLRHTCNINPGSNLFEIGPGTGQATRDLLKFNPAHIDLIEPDENLGAYLANALKDCDPIHIIQAPFEKADMPNDTYDLGIAAMSFHWVEADAGLQKIARLLKPGGHWAMWWTQFGDEQKPDDFSKAAKHLFDQFPKLPIKPGSDERQLASSHQARLDALQAQSKLTDIKTHEFTWLHEMSAEQLRGLFSTFSPILALEENKREDLLNEFETIVNEQFGGIHRKEVTTRLYTARNVS